MGAGHTTSVLPFCSCRSALLTQQSIALHQLCWPPLQWKQQPPVSLQLQTWAVVVLGCLARSRFVDDSLNNLCAWDVTAAVAEMVSNVLASC